MQHVDCRLIMNPLSRLPGLSPAVLRDFLGALRTIVVGALNNESLIDAVFDDSDVVLRVSDGHRFDQNNEPFELVVTVSPQGNGMYAVPPETARVKLASDVMQWAKAHVLPTELPHFGTISITVVCGNKRSGCTLSFTTQSIIECWGNGRDVDGVVV